jgi:putative oxidoreductase
MRKLATIGKWTIQILMGVLFVMIGTGKFLEPVWARNFARWGFPPGFHLVIGALELLGGIGLLVPSLASYAAVGLIAIMVGASLTHLVHGEMGRVGAPIPHMVLLAVVALVRLSSARRLGRRAVRPAAGEAPGIS